jgi:hypothetical protein
VSANAHAVSSEARSSIFISYSRTDRDFAVRLHALLKEQGREVWTDWQSIPATTAWEEEVAAGIDSADIFLIVLSPNWLGLARMPQGACARA